MTIIKIYEPHEKPFGMLSNNAEHRMYIETEISKIDMRSKERSQSMGPTIAYQSVTNYIYSNMLMDPSNKNIIRNTPPKKVILEYTNLRNNEIISTYRNALDTSIKVRYTEIPALINILLSTGESEIRYMAANDYLGMGKDSAGLNLYGKYLMQLRQQMKQEYLEKENEKNRKDREHQLYITYIVYKELVKKILSGDNLDEYEGKTAENILNDMMNTKEIMAKYPDEEFIIENLHRKYFKQPTAQTKRPVTKEEQEDEFMKVLTKPTVSGPVFVWVKAKINSVDDNKFSVTYESGVKEDNVPKIRVRFKNPTTGGWDREPSSPTLLGSGTDVLVKVNRVQQKEFAQHKEGQVTSKELKKPTRPKDWRVLSPGGSKGTIKGAAEPVTSIMIEQDIYDILNYPPSLVNIIRKKYLERMKELQLSLKAQMIFDMWMEFEIRRHYPDIPEKDYKKAKLQQFKNFNALQQADLQNRVEKLYNNKNLPKGLEENITTQIRNIIIPTEQEIKQAAEYVIPANAKTSDVFAQVYFRPAGPPIEIYPTYNSKPLNLREKDVGKEFTAKDEMEEKWAMLSPLYDGTPTDRFPLFEIDNQKFPTITHYVQYSLIKYYLQNKIESYQQILSDEYKSRVKLEGNPKFINEDTRNRLRLTIRDFLRPDIIEAKYQTQIVPNQTAIKLKNFAKIGLDKKFEDRVLQDVLLITENNELVFDDRKDAVLGTGKDKKGENYVGKYLTLLREKYVLEREGETLPYLTTKDVLNLIEKDAFFKAWIEMRVADMCRAIVTIKDYIWNKTDDTIKAKITPVLAQSVIDDIYQPCSHIFARVDDVLAPVPKYFENIILYNRQTKSLGFSKLPPENIKEIAEIIWKRIVIMIDTMIAFSNEKDILNIRYIIANLELLLSNSDFKCSDKIFENEHENCILSALFNIIEGIMTFNQKFDLDRTITSKEIDAATSIIINKDVSGQIQDTIDVDIDEGEEKMIEPPLQYEEETPGDIEDEDAGFLEGGEGGDYEPSDDELQIEEIDDPRGEEESEEAFQELVAQDDGPFYGGDYDGGYGGYESGFPKRSFAPGASKVNVQDKNLLIAKLKKMDGVDDPRKIANILISAINLIKTKKPEKTINNRINFFATQR